MAEEKPKQCPSCGSEGTRLESLLTGVSMGFEVPVDFDVYYCPHEHYWRVWDTGRVELILPEGKA